MMKPKHLFVLIGLALAGCAGKAPISETQTTPASRTAEVTILHQSNRYGVLEPCGCSVSPFGGIDREANAVGMIRKDSPNVLYLDAGNLFLRQMGPVKTDRFQAKSELVTDILNKIGLDAYQPGPFDYQLGKDFLTKLSERAKFAFVSSNTVGLDDKPLWKPYVVFERGGVKYGVLALLPSTFTADGVKVQDPKTTLDRLMPEVKAKSDVVILLSGLPVIEAQKLASAYPIQVVVGGVANFSTDAAQAFNTQKTLYVDAADQGYRLGRLDLTLELPFKQFQSVAAIDDQNALIEAMEKEAKRYPKNKDVQAMLQSMKLEPKMQIVDGGSFYTGSLIRLDKERFGKPNEITKMKLEDQKNLRAKAIGE
jgi:2',3'-cyclic-nucleotide 2'-phosphodiesterase (5'-nucleotidase family)